MAAQKSKATARCQPKRARKHLLAAVAGVMLPWSAVRGQTTLGYDWVGTTSNNWSNTSSWLATVDPLFHMGPPPNSTGDNSTSQGLWIEFDASGTTSYTATNNLSANPYWLEQFYLNNSGTGTITVAGTNPFSFTGPNNPSSISDVPQITQESTGAARVAPNLQLSKTTYLLADNPAGTGSVLLSGAITGTGGLTIYQPAVYLTATNNMYTGTTTIGADTIYNSGLTGTVFCAANNTLPSGTALVGTGMGTMLVMGITSTQIIGGVTIAPGNYNQMIGSLSGTGEVNVADATLTVGNSSNFTFNGQISGGDSGALIKVGTGTMTIGGEITTATTTINNGRIVPTSDFLLFGTQVIINVNNGLDLTAGGVQFPQIGGLAGSGSLSLSGNDLSILELDNTTYSGALSGTGSLKKEGLGTLLLSGGNTFVGPVTLAGGLLTVNADTGLGNTANTLTFAQGGGLRFGASFNLSSSRAISFLGAGVIDTQSFSTTISQGIADSALPGNLTKRGSGTLTLSGGNSYTSGTLLSQGTVIVNNSNGLGTAGTVTINDAPTDLLTTSLLLGPSVTLARDIQVINLGSGTTLGSTAGTSGAAVFSGSLTLNKDINVQALNTATLDSLHNPGQTRFDGSISGNGGITVSGGNMLQFGAGAKTYSGITHVTGTGTTLSVLAGGAPSNSTVALDSSTTLVLEGVSGAVIGGLSGAGSVSNNTARGSSTMSVGNNNQNTTISGIIGGSIGLTKIGTGTLTFTSTANSYSGATTLTAGVLSVAAGTNLGNAAATNGLVFNGGTLKTTAAISTARNITVLAPGGTLDTSAQTVTINGVGNTTLGGNLTITGAGTLLLSRSGGTPSITPGASITLSSGTALGLSGSVALSDAANRASILNNSATGFTVLGGTHQIANLDGTGNSGIAAGATLIADHIRQTSLSVDGTLRVRANGGNGGVSYLKSLSLGSSGLLDLNNNDLVIDYTGASPFTQLHQWVLEGYDNIHWISSSQPQATHGIITTTGFNTTAPEGEILALFDNINAGFTEWQIGSGMTVDSTTVIGKYTYPGDVNFDGQVNSGDYAILLNFVSKVTSGALWTQGDVNLDGQVTCDDFAIADSSRASALTAPLAPVAVAVPEPTGLMAVLGLAALWTRRKTR